MTLHSAARLLGPPSSSNVLFLSSGRRFSDIWSKLSEYVALHLTKQ